MDELAKTLSVLRSVCLTTQNIHFPGSLYTDEIMIKREVPYEAVH